MEVNHAAGRVTLSPATYSAIQTTDPAGSGQDSIRDAASFRRSSENTPQYACPALGEALGCEIIVKLETANPVRCFKGRGAETVMARLSDNPGARSAICASVGNLGLALAYSGQSRGIAVTVVAGAGANRYKLERVRASGATVRIVEGDFEEARHQARQMLRVEDAFLVEDSENLDTCEGAGTIGIELVKDADRIDAVLIALGGGAMATGVGHVFKCLAPQVEIVCVQPRGAPAMALSWRAKSVVETAHIPLGPLLLRNLGRLGPQPASRGLRRAPGALAPQAWRRRPPDLLLRGRLPRRPASAPGESLVLARPARAPACESGAGLRRRGNNSTDTSRSAYVIIAASGIGNSP